MLILAGILGFVGGAIAGATSGGREDPAAGTSESADPSAPATSTDGSPENTDETNSTAPAESDSVLSLTSPKDGGEVAAGESGRFDIEGSIDPPVGGVTVTIERSLDGGQTWEQAGSSTLRATTRDDGTYSTTFWSGREGENHFRAVGEDPDGNRIESNTIVVTVVAEDDGDD